ncbi:amidase [Nocardia brasiliensis]|uniref:amidase n=1 Tax=Nocardia brasiliensis TaxID=37326 RepID=UPI002453E3F8|nr:amidase [Nocardia brasiliensis]
MDIPPGSVDRIRLWTHAPYRRRVSALEVVQEALTSIHRVNSALHAFTHVDDVGALSCANRMDRHTPHGAKPLPLARVPFAVADLDDCLGMPSRYGSALYREVRPSAVESIVVRRLRAAGAIPIGKTAVSEFGWGPVACTDSGAVTRNPWIRTRSPGGDGGAAAAVAAGLVPFAVGSEWRGSIRTSAAHCGLVGFKPSHGLIPSSGMRTPGNYGGDLHSVGLLTASVADSALILELVAGPDPADRGSSAHFPQPYVEQLTRPIPSTTRIGWLADLGYPQADTEMFAHEVAGRIAAAVGTRLMVVRLVLDDLKALTAPAQLGLSAMLAATGLIPRCLQECGPEVRAVVADVVDERAGAPGLLSRLADAAECRAQWQIRVMDLFSRVDVLLIMSAPGVASCTAADLLGEVGNRPDLVSCEILANACWLPAASVPIGFSSMGLPVGLQVIARYGQDSTVLSVARLVEQACSEWQV